MTDTAIRRPWRASDSHAVAVGARIAAARENAGLSQRDAIAGTAYSPAYLSRIERGERLPSITFLRALAPNLGVTAAFLETGDDVVDVRIPVGLAKKLASGGMPTAGRSELFGACVDALEGVPA